MYPIYPKRLGSICTPVITAIFGPRLASLSNIALISSTEASSPGYGVLVINAASDIFGRIISASEQRVVIFLANAMSKPVYNFPLSAIAGSTMI